MREIDEAVRQDDATQFFEKYGVMLGSALALVLAAFGGYLVWDNYREGGLEAQSETLVQALDQSEAGDFAGADATVAELTTSDNDGARTAARFMQAAAALEQGEMAKAVELYGTIAADDNAPPALRDLARVREVATNFDDREPADIIAKLKDLAVPGNAFFGSAGELTAIAHLEAGDRDAAGTLFGEIAKDEELPETLRARARQMAGLLGIDAVEDVDKLLEDQGIDPEAGLVEQPQ
ncbi:tetratricopeptide repeat protein [Erythrobacter sp. WH158]|uniref:Tetratricopeptide repeat protein n=2 Tax=Erythrobacter crassostreae TaxID=2828328 RepID=A0A9X1F3F9_9SPHN|nr:tetratricopeptide repeat protein [Erythrobacter crassostrea]MBV7259572.1 tetratricopeptide repeat protein [Erythrobacter crassostrea]